MCPLMFVPIFRQQRFINRPSRLWCRRCSRRSAVGRLEGLSRGHAPPLGAAQLPQCLPRQGLPLNHLGNSASRTDTTLPLAPAPHRASSRKLLLCSGSRAESSGTGRKPSRRRQHLASARVEQIDHRAVVAPRPEVTSSSLRNADGQPEASRTSTTAWTAHTVATGAWRPTTSVPAKSCGRATTARLIQISPPSEAAPRHQDMPRAARLPPLGQALRKASQQPALRFLAGGLD